MLSLVGGGWGGLLWPPAVAGTEASPTPQNFTPTLTLLQPGPVKGEAIKGISPKTN